MIRSQNDYIPYQKRAVDKIRGWWRYCRQNDLVPILVATIFKSPIFELSTIRFILNYQFSFNDLPSNCYRWSNWYLLLFLPPNGFLKMTIWWLVDSQKQLKNKLFKNWKIKCLSSIGCHFLLDRQWWHTLQL